jgi:hypothetical protein
MRIHPGGSDILRAERQAGPDDAQRRQRDTTGQRTHEVPCSPIAGQQRAGVVRDGAREAIAER